MPSLKKAELIEGIVYMSSPVRVNYHAQLHALITTWLGTYWTATPGVNLCLEPTVRLDGVQEYLVWQVEEQKIVWFSLKAGDFVPFQAGDRGIIYSKVFSRLWLDKIALLRRNLETVLPVLQQGLQISEHEAFKQKLIQTRSL